jgi:hypothetical protein
LSPSNTYWLVYADNNRYNVVVYDGVVYTYWKNSLPYNKPEGTYELVTPPYTVEGVVTE